MIGGIADGSLASQCRPKLIDGLVLVRVGNQDVRGFPANDVLTMLRNAGRPLRLVFVQLPQVEKMPGYDESDDFEHDKWSPRSNESSDGFLYQTVSEESDDWSDDDSSCSTGKEVAASLPMPLSASMVDEPLDNLRGQCRRAHHPNANS